jgi:hypothetical protein
MRDFNVLSRMAARELPEKFLVAFSFAGEQRDLVRAIAEAVEKKIGTSNVFFDEWFEHYLAGHDAELKLQEIYGEKCELTVVCVSGHYGAKVWTQAEHERIRARVMKSRVSADRRDQLAILPIRVGDGDVKGIPFNAIVPDIRNRPPDRTADLIVDRLRLIVPGLGLGAGSSPAELSWPEPPTTLRWPMADHRGVREAFACLLAREAPWRFLPILGPSETGKSHITRQMLANALEIPQLACGRFDFKGTTDMDAEVRAFVQDLGVPTPPASSHLNERLGHILDELKRRARPTFVVFDTYEVAGEARDWVERRLLSSLVRSTWLRVVIAGQRVPEFAGAVWASVARAPLQLMPPPPEDWFEYGQKHRPALKLAEVKTACRLASNKASLLAQLLGPVT